MRMSAVARHRNSMPKENSKSQIEKRKKAEERYRSRICCKKCKQSNITLYKVKDNYYCKDCKEKLKKKIKD